MYDLSIVIPCYNESRNILALVTRLEATGIKNNMRAEVVLVDDASRDNTREIIQSLLPTHPNLKLVSHETNRGIVGGWESGTEAATSPYVCFMDADLQNLPEDVPRLYQEILNTHADMVQGWRNPVNKNKHFLRVFVSRALNFLLNTLFRMHLHDNKSGFVIAKKDTMMHILQYGRDYAYPQTFIAVSAKTKGYLIRDIETAFADRAAGESFLTGKILSASFNSLIDLAKGVFEFGLF